MIQHRCSLSPMPSDISSNHTAQIPYLGQHFELVAREAGEAGFEIEHWDESCHIHTMQVRGPKVLMVVTRKGIVKAMGDNVWSPLP